MIGFIYQWIDKHTGLIYIGRHEGDPTDSYIGSGTVFITEYLARPTDFEREIIWCTHESVAALIAKEEELLSSIPDDELYHGCNRKFYNQVRNSSGYTSIDNPMRLPEIAKKMMDTKKRMGINRNIWENKVNKHGYDAACRLNAKGDKSAGGKANKNKPKSEEHKKNISLNRKGGKSKGWKKNNAPVTELV